MNLRRLQDEQRKWAEHNFPEAMPEDIILGVMEELGELSHGHLKMIQNIRGNREAHVNEIEDAIGDMIIYIAHYCNIMGIDFGSVISETWARVQFRDWKKYPGDGISE